MAGVLRRVFKREHASTIILISAAIATVGGLSDRLGLDNTRVLSGLIGLLAIDILIEKLGYFDRLEALVRGELLEKVTQVQRDTRESYLHRLPVETVVRPRTETKPFTTLLTSAKEVWLAGKGLSGFLNANSTAIKAALESGVKFRILIHDPNAKEQLYAVARNSVTNEDPQRVKQLLEGTLHQLDKLSRSAPEGTLEVRVAYAPLYNGYTILNPARSDGICHVEFYSFRVSLSERLVITISEARDPALFAFHVKRFQELWDYSIIAYGTGKAS